VTWRPSNRLAALSPVCGRSSVVVSMSVNRMRSGMSSRDSEARAAAGADD
jgi:hypothetical protein